MATFIDKIEHSKELIAESAKKYERIAVGCSFGKDSMVTVHLARTVAPEISVFSIMTIYKPQKTLEYLVEINKKFDLNTLVYVVAKETPEILEQVNVVLLPYEDFEKESDYVRKELNKEMYSVCPDECCGLLKVVPTQEAVKNLDAWIAGLRKTEGFTRENFQEIEIIGNITKINPILEWTELDVWRYLAINQIPANPLYAEGYRSLGCAPCSKVTDEDESERAGRWQGTAKHGGECGIHTKRLK
ncbi:phosphoadenylyl-sulfate reductase [Candidatus Pacearchaeota archaeon]|nr:phosphoadenylyl-sulfate reductase [Candidatus Pacearchaeota archaeon]